jgi:hypothetical protein
MFILFGVVKCSQPAHQSVYAPLAVAAQDTAQGQAFPIVSGQSLIAIAKQEKATVVNISSVKKGGAERFETPFFDDPFSASSSVKNSNDGIPCLANAGNRG